MFIRVSFNENEPPRSLKTSTKLYGYTENRPLYLEVVTLFVVIICWLLYARFCIVFRNAASLCLAQPPKRALSLSGYAALRQFWGKRALALPLSPYFLLCCLVVFGSKFPHLTAQSHFVSDSYFIIRIPEGPPDLWTSRLQHLGLLFQAARQTCKCIT